MDSRIMHESLVDVSAVVTVNVPVSEPVDIFSATPIAIVAVPDRSAISEKPPPQLENSAFVEFPSYSTQIAMSRSPAFFVNDDRLGNVLVAPPAVLSVNRIRDPAVVGMLGNAIPEGYGV